jgi:hypothetical protein
MREHRPQACIVLPCTTSPHACPALCLVVPGEGSPGAATSAVLRRNSDAGKVRWKQQQAR